MSIFHKMIPYASPFWMRAIMSPNTGRPSDFALHFSTNSSAIPNPFSFFVREVRALWRSRFERSTVGNPHFLESSCF